MRKIRLLGVALIALFAFGALTAVSASAAFLLAEWLVGGAAVTTELSVETTGELLLEDDKVPIIGKAVVLCAGIGKGWVGPNSLGWASEVLSLSSEAISTTPLTGLPLECTAQAGCEANTLVSVWPVGMPYAIEVELVEQTGEVFFAAFLKGSAGGNIGWEITNCLVLGTSMGDECVAAEGASELTLEGPTLLAIASLAFLELIGSDPANCTQGGEHSGIVEGEGALILTGGGELTASSETSTA